MTTSNLAAERGKVMCFGELLLRIAPDDHANWLRTNLLPFFVGGAEANVAVALSNWKVPVSYLTALPQNTVTEPLLGYLTHLGVDVSKTLCQGNRLGLFYLTAGHDMKNTAVIYDRAKSSFSELSTGSIDWDEKLKDISWFHFSAISPALSQSVAEVCMEALVAANRKGINVSVDLNYRSKLWQYGKHPIEIMPELVSYCDLIMGNLWAAEKMLGIPVDRKITDKSEKNDFVSGAQEMGKQIFENFPKCRTVAQTFRFDIYQDGLSYYTTLHQNSGEFNLSEEYFAYDVVDKVGSGDCFMAGLIYGFQNKLDNRQILEFATAAAFKKLFIKGDFSTSSIEDINKFKEKNAN